MPEAVIVDAIRTPIGRAVKGSLKSVRADDLAAVPLKALIERNPQLDQKSIEPRLVELMAQADAERRGNHDGRHHRDPDNQIEISQ